MTPVRPNLMVQVMALTAAALAQVEREADARHPAPPRPPEPEDPRATQYRAERIARKAAAFARRSKHG